jgi:hypothetical protein
MKWVKRKYKLKAGDRRTIRKFLLFPKTLDKVTIWLEFVDIKQIVEKKSVKKINGGFKWKSIKFK